MYSDALIINTFIGGTLVTLLLFLDLYEKEKVLFIGKVFFFSIVITTLYSMLKFSMFNFDDSNKLFETLYFAPITEELLKFTFLYVLIVNWSKEVNESFDMIVYIGIIALGFSVNENIGYYMKFTQESANFSYITQNPLYYHESLKNIIIARIIPAHLLIDVSSVIVVGFYFKKGHLLVRLCFSYIIAVILHYVWNFIASSEIELINYYAIFLVFLSSFSAYTLLRISRFKNNPLEEFDEYGVSKKEKYDWRYYLLVYVFLIIIGILGMLTALFINMVI